MGSHILSGDLTYNSTAEYWYFDFPQSSMNEGTYNYYVYCNHTHAGGAVDGAFVSDGFIIQDGGYQLIQSPDAWLPLIVGLALFTIIILIISVNIREKSLQGLKSFTFLLGIIDGFLIFFLIYLVSINPINPSISEPFMLGFIISHGLALIAIIWMYAAYLIGRTMDNISNG